VLLAECYTATSLYTHTHTILCRIM
jgi:hypothetical protein